MKKLLILFLSIAPLFLLSQEINKLSLEQAKAYALEHNYDMRNAETDVEIAKNRVKETLATGLPQINGGISNTNYIDIPTQLLPDFITPAVYQANQQYFGLTPEKPLGETQFFPVQFGTKHNATASVSASQLIFNGQFIVGLRASRTFLENTRIQNVKSRVEVKNATSIAYYSVLLTEENYDVLRENLEQTKKMADQTTELYKEGFIDETETDQLNLLVANMETALLSLENQINIAYANLKLTLGMSLEDSLQLADDLEYLIDQIDYGTLLAEKFNINNNLDYKILRKQKELTVNQLNLERAAYLPTLSAFFSAQTQALRSEYNFLDGDEPWYPTTLWGFEMNIPLFSSGNRAAKVQKAKLELRKMEVLDSKMQSSLNINVSRAKTNLYNAFLVYQNKKSNLELAEKIKNRMGEKFTEGVSSSMDLLQANNQYLTAESEYINAVMDLVNAELSLEKLMYEDD